MMNDYIQAIQNYLKDHGFEQLAPEAVLFDMDGVLFDSMRLHNESWQATATAYNLEMLPDEPYTLEGCTSTLMERTHQRQATAEELETIYTEKRWRFNALPRPKRMPGAAEMLEKVGRDGLQRVVVTGSGQRSLLERLQTAFPNVFRDDLIVSSKDYTQGKPAPDPYLCGLKRTSLRPNQALVVENAPELALSFYVGFGDALGGNPRGHCGLCAHEIENTRWGDAYKQMLHQKRDIHYIYSAVRRATPKWCARRWAFV